MRKVVLCAACLLFVCATACLAEDPEKQRSFKSLMVDGYEIKAVTAYEQYMIVSLQKDTSAAVCTFAAGDWERMTDRASANPGLCDVRKF